jgi:hypothetical protein
MTTTLVGEYRHRSPLNAPVEGGMQMLPDGDAVIGWGVQPFFSEDDAAGNEILNGRFNERIASYRAYRFVWNAQPSTLPALALSATSPDTRQLYASWNGATDVASWRVLGGTSPAALAPVATAAQAGFETAISVTSRARYFAVQAVGADGRVLARSQVVTVRGGH